MNPLEYIAQKRFDEMYITSSEIAQRLEVTRPAIHFRRKHGLLPCAISVPGNQLFIWERSFIEPHLRKWEEQLNSKRVKTSNDEQAALGSTSN
mgnify:CR=1 FL=1